MKREQLGAARLVEQHIHTRKLNDHSRRRLCRGNRGFEPIWTIENCEMCGFLSSGHLADFDRVGFYQSMRHANHGPVAEIEFSSQLGCDEAATWILVRQAGTCDVKDVSANCIRDGNVEVRFLRSKRCVFGVLVGSVSARMLDDENSLINRARGSK
jgi:hypothetical protein